MENVTAPPPPSPALSKASTLYCWWPPVQYLLEELASQKFGHLSASSDRRAEKLKVDVLRKKKKKKNLESIVDLSCLVDMQFWKAALCDVTSGAAICSS